MTNHQDLTDLDQRADRMLDGMSVHRDKFARDVKTITQELRNWRDAFARMERESKTAESATKGFGSTFDDLFGEAFRGRR